MRKRPSKLVRLKDVAVRVFEHNNESYVPVSDLMDVLGGKTLSVERKLVLLVSELDRESGMWFDSVRRVITANVFLELLERFGYENIAEAIELLSVPRRDEADGSK